MIQNLYVVAFLLARFWGGTEFYTASDEECVHVFHSLVFLPVLLEQNLQAQDSLMGYRPGGHVSS